MDTWAALMVAVPGDTSNLADKDKTYPGRLGRCLVEREDLSLVSLCMHEGVSMFLPLCGHARYTPPLKNW